MCFFVYSWCAWFVWCVLVGVVLSVWFSLPCLFVCVDCFVAVVVVACVSSLVRCCCCVAAGVVAVLFVVAVRF